MSTEPHPGLAGQRQHRTALRVSGVLVLGAGLLLAGIGLADFFASFGSASSEMPTKFHYVFFGLPLAAVGGWLLQAGFLGVAARYAAGETMPVVKDSAAYLTDGEGLLGVGRTVDDPGRRAVGPFCRSCGVRNDSDARFCDGCGQSLV